MKETLIDLKTRRSVRAYTDKVPSDDILEKIMEAAVYAPTGMGKQSPKIVVISDKEDRDYLERLNAAVMGNPDAKTFYGAPVVAVVLADPDIMTYRDDGNLVIGNLLNAAHALGVDSCYIYRAREVFASPEGKALLKKWGIDERYEGIGNCILGYAAAEPAAPRERKTDYVTYIR
ncbi:MAG: nitroreductase [Clostridia bacterium]|nr:nitroreductase [Clostridia bacterium]